MQKKKSPQADLELKRSTFLQTGFVAAIALALAAFTWTSYDVSTGLIDPDTELDILVLEDDIMPLYIPERPKVEKKKLVIIDKILLVKEEPLQTDEKPDDKLDEPELDLDFNLEGADDDVPDVIIKTDLGTVGFMAVEQKPYFAECEDVLDPIAEMQCTHIKVTRWVNQQARFPLRARDRGDQGTVEVGFVINKKGEVEDVEVLKSVSPDLDKEAVRAVSTLPDFIPGSQQGRPVKVAYKIPVRFVIK